MTDHAIAERTVSLRRARLRCALMAGAATGFAAFGGAAHAQLMPTVSQSEIGSIVYSADTLDGGPAVLELSSEEGSVTADVKTIRSTNGSVQTDDTIAQLETNGSGAVNGTFGTITATGATGSAQALEADTDVGAITLKTGTIDLSGEYTRGILAESNTGNIAINADTTILRGLGLRDEDGQTGEGISAFTDGTIAITSNLTQVEGRYASAVVAAGGGDTTVNSTRAVTASDQTISIYASSTRGNTSITSGTIENNAAVGGLAINALATAGNVAVKSGTIQTKGTGAAAITATANNGTVAIASDRISGSGANSMGITGRGLNVSVASGEVQTGRQGIVATGVGTASTVSVQTTGLTAVQTGNAIQASGVDVAVSTGGETRSASGGGIFATGTNVAVTTGADTRTAGTTTALGANGQNVTVTNGGTVAGVGPATFGINAVSNNAAGRTTVTSKAVTLDGTSNGSFAAGIYAVANGGAPVTVDSGSIATGGTDAYGLYVSGQGAISVKSGSIANSAVSRQALRIAGGAGDVTLTSGSIDVADAMTAGIFTSTNTGNIAIQSGRVTQGGTAGTQSGINYGIYATTNANGTGNISIASEEVTTSGLFAIGINGSAGGNLSITSNKVTTNATSIGIVGNSRNGNVAVASDTVTLNGTGSGGISATANNGRADVTSKAIVGVGANSYGIAARGGTGVGVTSGSVQSQRTGIYALSTNGDAAVTTTGATVSSQLAGIDASGGNVSITTGADSMTSGATYGIIVAARDGATIANGGTVAATGAGSSAIQVSAPGAIAITSNNVTVEGAGDPAAMPAGGIVALGGQGAVSITSNSATVAGAGRNGIYANGLNAVSVQSGKVDVAGDGVSGILVSGGAGPITIASQDVTGSGASQIGIAAYAASGPVAITSGNVTVGGVSASGIQAQSSGAVTIDAGRTVSTAAGYDEDSGQTAEAIYAYSSRGPVTIRSEEASTAGLYASAIAAVSGTTRTPGGDVSITSGLATSSGDTNATIYAASRGGNVVIDSDTTTTTGADVAAIYGFASTGSVSVEAAKISSTGARSTGINVSADNGASVTAGDVAATADAIFIRSRLAQARALLTGTVSSAEGNALTVNGSDVAIETASGAKLSGVNGILATGAGNSVVAQAGGITASDTGIRFDGGRLTNSGSVTGTNYSVHATGAAVIGNSGTLTGTLLADAALDLTNTGTITSSTGPAVQVNGPAHLVNGGTIGSASGIAVQLGAASDYVELRTGSSVGGYILGGGGDDVLNLVGTSATQTAAQKVAMFDEFAALNVASGYWTADAGPSFAGLVNIQNGATLRYNEVTLGGQSYSPIYSDAIHNDGKLVIDFRSINTTGNLDGIAVSGTGGVDFVGTGQFVADSDALTYTGATTISNGSVVLLGNLPGAVTINAGGTLKLGANNTLGTLGGNVVNNGTFVYDRSDSYTYGGLFDGTGSLVKNGAGTLTFGGGYSFNGTTTINGGGIRIAGAVDPTSSIAVQSGTVDFTAASAPVIASLSGGSGGSVAIGSNTLTVNQSGSTTFGGTLTGNGALVKTGAGRLNITGVNPFTGATTVSGGTLAVNGSLAGSALTVANGGTLGGNGTVGVTTVASGGTFAPGNSIGTTRVNGNLTFGAGSVYQVEVNAAGQSDLVIASGRATISGGTVQVLADGTTRYNGRTGYTILTASGGVAGTFTGVTSNLAFLTPTLGYTTDSVTLTLTRNNVDFVTVGRTPNQRAVGTAVQALGAGNALFEEALLLSDTGAALSFDALSGEYHADVSTALLADTQPLRQSLLLQPNQGEGLRAWGFAVGSRLSARTADSGVRAQRGMLGGIAGLGYAGGGFDIGVGGGYGHSDINVLGLASSGGVDTTYAAAYAGYRVGGFALRAGGTYAWHDVDGQRRAQIGAAGGVVRSAYKAHTWQAFGEIGYALPSDAIAVEPFAGIAYASQKVDGFAETGGITALTVARNERDATFSTLGVRASAEIGKMQDVSFAPRVSGAWQHGWGDLTGLGTMRFAGAASGFAISGARLPRDAAQLSAGVDIDHGPARLSLGYVGTVGRDWHDHGLQANLTIRF